MSRGVTMDHAFPPRSAWIGDGKFPQHPADLCTSVAVTRGLPAGTCFGPCALHHAFHDIIAFIAHKCTDRRAKSYLFRVDPEAMRNSAPLQSWLRLVQAARNDAEKNAEAFLKAGHLYVRTTRDVQPEEELLVWYDQELSHILGFTDISRGSSDELKCGRCNQEFKHEYPFLAHCRFLCAQIKSDYWSRDVCAPVKKQHRVTDFHNIARDLEHKRTGGGEDAEVPPVKRKCEESQFVKERKSVLLEKTNISNITTPSREQDQAPGDASEGAGKLKADLAKSDTLRCKSDASVEGGDDTVALGREKEKDAQLEAGESSGMRSGGSAFSPVLSNGQGEQKSAFCKPSKKASSSEPTYFGNAPAAPCSRQGGRGRDAFAPRTLLGYGNLMASAVLSTDIHGGPGGFHYAPEHWPRSIGAQVPGASSLAILPPTFTSLGVSVQNWCAKCNLSFRMTSDLVFHMRSHHKKEFAAESQVRRRREEKLTCPICHEYFRERHHLSRHMTSHN